MPKRQVQAEDLLRIRLPMDVQISTDGERIAYVLRRVDADKNRYFTELAVVPTDSGEPRLFTPGDHADSAPRWSPDGRWLAFVSDRSESSQVWLIPTDGGEARQLTRLEEGAVAQLRWAPDGSRLAFVYRPKPEADRKKAREEREKEHRSSPPREVRALHYREEAVGFFGAEKWHVYTVSVPDGVVTQVTDGRYNEQSPSWSPDGARLAFLSNRQPDPDLEPNYIDVFVVPAEGGEPERLETPAGPKHSLAWSPDGNWLAYVAHTRPEERWGTPNNDLWIVPAAGGEARNLSGHLDRPVGDYSLSDTYSFGGGEIGPFWSGDSRFLYCVISDRGASHVYRADTDGKTEALTEGALHVAAISLDRQGRRLAAILDSPTEPGEVYVAETGGGPLSFRQRTTENATFLAEVAPVAPDEFNAPGEAGEVHGWLLKPPGFSAEKRYPLLLYIHGGPHTQYGLGFFHELQLHAANGYLVLYTNPRGSKGYGYEHTAAIRGSWGEADYRDLMAAVDRAVALPFVDEARLGVLGGSFGGFMTSWIVGHTDRFAAACSQRAVNNLHSMAGTCDFTMGDRDYFDGNAWDAPEALWKYSPLTYAANVKTPLLILHSEGDLRCPIEQADQYFTALRRLKKEVLYVRFPPEANHGLSRGGPPDLRLARLRYISEWFRKYLKPGS